MHQSSPFEHHKDALPHPESADAPPNDVVSTKPSHETRLNHASSTSSYSPTCDCATHHASHDPSIFDLSSKQDGSLSSDITMSPRKHDIDESLSRARYKRLTSIDEIELGFDHWKQLDVRTYSPLNESIWFREALLAFATEDTRSISAVTIDDRWIAVAPFVEKVVRGARRWCFAGVGELHEPADFVAFDRASLNQLLQALLRAGRPILLERVLVQSPSIECIAEIFSRRAIVIKRPQASCPFIKLDETWCEPESHLNAGRRSDFRRARRKAEKLGEVAIQIINPGVDVLDGLLDQAFQVEGKSWKGDAKTALVHDSKRARFFRAYARRAAEAGILRICFLKIDGQPAAMQLAIEHKQGFWLLKVGYDPQFRSCSPGLLLMRETIRYSAEQGLNTYEFLGVAEDWTVVWTRSERPTVSMWIYPISWSGLLALFVDLAAKLLFRWSRP